MQVISPPVKIHPGTFADLTMIHEIDEVASGDYAWSLEEFKRVYTKANISFLAPKIGGKVVGFAVYKQFRDHTGLIKVAVHPAWQRHGIGSHVLRNLIKTQGRNILSVLVPEDLLQAQLFFRDKILMRYAGTQKGLFREGFRDGYLMEVQATTWTA